MIIKISIIFWRLSWHFFLLFPQFAKILLSFAQFHFKWMSKKTACVYSCAFCSINGNGKSILREKILLYSPIELLKNESQGWEGGENKNTREELSRTIA